jgi:cohesin complex subunit SCC1
MFYSTQILAKKGPLGLVWIAAHMDRQLKRQQINDASVIGAGGAWASMAAAARRRGC